MSIKTSELPPEQPRARQYIFLRHSLMGGAAQNLFHLATEQSSNPTK